MRNEPYYHPALLGTSTSRSIDGIVSSVTYRSTHLQIICLATENEKHIVFVPRKLFIADLAEGLCLRIHGEDRHKDYYGDIFIANDLRKTKPVIALFFLFSIYNFHLLNRIALKKIIVDNPDMLIVSVEQNDITYLIEKFDVSYYIAIRLLKFAQDNLVWCGKNEII